MKSRIAMMAFLLASAALPGCRTVQPANPVLEALQVAATPEPLDRVSPPGEQRHAKAAMVRWTERFLGHEYRVTGQRFVLLEPGFTTGAQIGSKAHRHVTQQLNGALQTNGWYGDEDYMLFLWRLNQRSPRYLAFVMTRDFLPGTDERGLVGYFALESVKPEPDR